MAKLTQEEAAKLAAEINAIAPGVARVEGGSDGQVLTVRARMTHAATGNAANWFSHTAPEIPAVALIVAGLKKQLGISAKATRSAIRRERGAS